MQRLLSWAHNNGITLSTATVGSVSVDLVPMATSFPRKIDDKPLPNIYDEMGGGLLAKLEAKDSQDDYEPAVKS